MRLIDDTSTREHVLDMIVRLGPITSTTVAKELDLTAAGIRRHITSLEADHLIVEHELHGPQPPRRGRPARHYVATDTGRAKLRDAYADLATDAMRFIADAGGSQAVSDFATLQFAALGERYAQAIEAAGPDIRSRAAALVDHLTRDGFAASLREVGDGFALQLCQGHCPMMKVAEVFPELCEAETRVFARLLDIHVQRLATLADGEHVCTTNIPLTGRTQLEGIA